MSEKETKQKEASLRLAEIAALAKLNEFAEAMTSGFVIKSLAIGVLYFERPNEAELLYQKMITGLDECKQMLTTARDTAKEAAREEAKDRGESAAA